MLSFTFFTSLKKKHMFFKENKTLNELIKNKYKKGKFGKC